MTKKNIFKFQIFLASLINISKYTHRDDIFLEFSEFFKKNKKKFLKISEYSKNILLRRVYLNMFIKDAKNI